MSSVTTLTPNPWLKQYSSFCQNPIFMKGHSCVTLVWLNSSNENNYRPTAD